MAPRRIELPGDPWQYATWEGAERARLLAGAQLGLREKLQWLEEASELVERLGRRGRRRQTTPGGDQP